MKVLRIQCFLLCVYYCVQEGLSGDFKTHLRRNFQFQRTKRQSKPAKPVLKVTDYHVRCSVASRYAVTTIQSSVWNQLPITKEAAFEVDLPSSAFISNFTIASNGKVYVAQVKERAAARKIYDAAKKQGKTAGLVATKEREIEKFRVAVSVPSGTRMSFVLTYEELLPRRLGRYELSLGLRTGQPVQNLTLDVSIHERTGISFIKALPLKTSRLLSNSALGDSSPPASTRVEQSDNCARIYYNPTLQQQTSASPKGLNADFIIQYDVELKDLLGDVQVYDGYFVHFFAPRGLPVVPKDIIFVIDVSGSMIGTKIKQTKQAMNTILGDLREGDHFNIITFSDKVHTWKKGRTVRATRQNVREAKEFVKRINAEGWTNINAALLSAAQLVNPSSSGSSSRPASQRVPLVIFLTDGEATTGVTSGDTILNNAKKALGSVTLFGIAFGDDADFLLLRRLALENRGVARMVYEEADAALQLKGFYDEVANPLLSDVQLSYMDDQAFDITHTLFPNYFQGSELVVAGRVKPGVKDLKVSVSATDSKHNISLEDNVLISSAKENGSRGFLNCSGELEGVSNFVRRLWAYFTIKELLLGKLNATDPATQRLLADKATNLSLKYNFVTPVTSLVVVKPDADEAAQALTTVKPTTTGTTTTTTAITTTATTARPIEMLTTRVPRKPSLRLAKPHPPQQPANKQKTKPLPVSLAKTKAPPTKKTAINPSPSPIKTAPATISGKKLAASQDDPKTPLHSPKLSTSLLNALKTTQPPAPGKTTTIPTTTTMQTLDTSTSPHLTSSRTDPEAGTRRTGPGKTSGPFSEVENRTKSAPDLHQSETPAATLRSPTPASPPDVGHNSSNLDVDTNLSFATLVLGTFAPMPGVTEGPGLWEAAGLLDVSTSIQSEDLNLVTDFDATYNYDYDIGYDTWDDSSDSFVLGSEEDCPLVECLVLLEPQSRLNSVRLFSSSVDGDPHFVVQLPKLHQDLCFTVDGRANDVLRLLEDPERGIIVDGHLMGAPPKPGAELRSRTYFDRLTISLPAGSSADIMITLTLDGVVVDGEGREILPTNQQGSVTRQGMTVTVDNHQSCWIELAKGVRFLVLFHHYKHPNHLQMAHLGFYITDGRGLSRSTQGLLGQFQHSDMTVTVTTDRHPKNKDRVQARGILRWAAQQMDVTLQDKTVKDSVQKRHLGKCWVVPKAEIERLLSHSYESYVVNNM
ncbi:inter-alpha-trypsin inhibitor heavy chain H6 isoform X2 [Poecilia formosa]|uniref:inter-alpha-trypsin inhibitor heavy chain H6 isoform X2 n=1 Tax=Poecilia formosa TaxID=48698 RepID=UPI0004440274|nr:PREDICTED: inter-alpha-trypsin inhibitor heavy chain H6 isoform X2 [Poecilia formosa]